MRFARLGEDFTEPVEPAFEIGVVLMQGAVLEIGAAAADGDGTQQQPFEL